MILLDTYKGDMMTVKAANEPPFGPGFTTEQVEKAVKMELWGTGFKDAGQDACEFRLIDEKGNTVATRRLNGY